MNEICNTCKCCSMDWDTCSNCDHGFVERDDIGGAYLEKCDWCNGEGGSLVCIDRNCNGVEPMRLEDSNKSDTES